MATETFKFYFGDLTDECQARFTEFLGGENGNYDTIPLAELECEVDQETINQRFTCKILKDSILAVTLKSSRDSWLASATNQLMMVEEKCNQLNSWRAYSIWDIVFYGLFTGLVSLAVSLLVSYGDRWAQLTSFIAGMILGVIIQIASIQRPRIKRWRDEINAQYNRVSKIVDETRELHASYIEDPDVVACRKVFEDNNLPFAESELSEVLKLVPYGGDTLEKAVALRVMNRNTAYTESTEGNDNGAD